jgi:pyruvate/2-oxoglutarate dehydrogenase complex dihydrolipoamide dehydrogenase (E3) component
VAVDRFEGKGGRFLRGEGRVVGPGSVTVGGERVQARRGVVIATGTSPAIPPVPGLDQVPYWTNRDAVEAEELPGSPVVLGGGAIGVELAQVFARFGVDVTVVEALDRLLPADEPEVGPILGEVLAGESVDVRVGTTVETVQRDGAKVAAELDDGTAVAAARLLVATGRRADLAALGVDSVGVDQSQRWLAVDEHLRVADGVWAVGDVTGKGAFTHVALYQSPIAAADILGHPSPPADYRAVPHVTFTDPEVGAVGLSEAAARDAGVDVRVGTARVPQTARGWIHRPATRG